MHVLSLLINRSKSLHDQEIPLDGLVLLFGANSSGKTSVLEAISQILGSEMEVRIDPADYDSRVVHGMVEFDLPGVATGKEPDAELFRRLICGEYENGTSWKWLDDDAAELLRGEKEEDARQYLVERLVEASTSGSGDDRLLVAEEAFRSLVFVASPLQCSIVVDGSRFTKSRSARAAAARIVAAGGDPDDVLGSLARSVGEGATFELGSVRMSFLSPVPRPPVWMAISGALPAVVPLDAEPQSLNIELRDSLPRVHDNVWLHALEPASPLVTGHFVVVDHDPFEMAPEWESDGYRADPWLETPVLDDGHEGATDLPEFVFGYDKREWYRVRHSPLETAELVAKRANEIVPSFVSEQGEIVIEILPVAAWLSEPARVRVRFVEGGHGDPHDIDVLGAGTARWVAASVRLACRQLATAARVVVDAEGNTVTDRGEANRIIDQAAATHLTPPAFASNPSTLTRSTS